jgi:uncharacterized membrane protein
LHLKTHHAGHDLTLAMKAAPHGPEVMQRYEAIADLVEGKKPAPSGPLFKTPSPMVAMILDRHPHPISVHFPIALCVSAAFLAGLSLFVTDPALERAVTYNLILAALSTPVSIFTGLLSWYYNYNGIWTHIYRMKTYLSIILVILFVVVLVARFGFLSGSETGRFWYWIHTATVLAMAPTVMGLGYYGGKITFPS